MNPDHLVELARQIAQIGGGKPRQVALKRAISTAYYAVFHALCQHCASSVVGTSFRSTRYWMIVTPIYRALDHGRAKSAVLLLANDASSSSLLKELGRAFENLYAARAAADYDPGARYTGRTVSDLIAQAEVAISAVGRLEREESILLAVQLLGKSRPGGGGQR